MFSLVLQQLHDLVNMDEGKCYEVKMFGGSMTRLTH